jgi:hypothetical protein
MSRKGKLVTPQEFAEIHQVAYTTVMYWLKTDRISGAKKLETPRGPYWMIPDDAPRPPKLSGRPKKGTKKAAKKERDEA